ncbi:hypothetical protein LJK88_22625 [Paenibacillus sp. P26]|nr:hypothetical protein LJK88_22625 [Paenibacillus sp. P26]UUZ95668.1 hypothetical protein LJK87_15250 [Paenibacillus sp. P25]
MKWLKWIWLWCAILLSVSGRGKNLPVLTTEQLQNKMSVLVVSGSEPPRPVADMLQKTLIAWRDQKQISFEWMVKTDSLSPEQLNKINERPYDYIIVLGHNVVANVLPSAKQITSRKWVLLDDMIGGSPDGVNSSNILLKAVPADRIRSEWDEWVKQQQITGRGIEWVTNSSRPIPSDWAPSEEAETISLTDAQGWYPQFQTQVRQHGPSWIVLYAPVDDAILQRMKNLQVPIMNIAATSLQLQWDAILAGLEQMMEKKTWAPGTQTYTEQEMRILKNF